MYRGAGEVVEGPISVARVFYQLEHRQEFDVAGEGEPSRPDQPGAQSLIGTITFVDGVIPALPELLTLLMEDGRELDFHVLDHYSAQMKSYRVRGAGAIR